jgi:CheY-like chemotaxis protein
MFRSRPGSHPHTFQLAEPAGPPLAPRQVARSVLLIEDDLDNRESIAEALVLAGFRVHALATGAEGLKMLEDSRCPRLILLDLKMPGLCGREFLASVATRPDRKRFRVILISADPSVRDLASRPRVVEVLCKPFGLESLLEAARRHG